MNPMSHMLRTIVLERATHQEPHLTVKDSKALRRWELADKYYPRHAEKGMITNEEL